MKDYITYTSFKRNEIVKEIISFVSLNQDWDGYGALPLQVESAANAILITNQLTDSDLLKISAVYPNPHGTITFDWENDLAERISLEVGNTSFSYYVKVSSGSPEYFNNVKFDHTEIEKFTKLFQSNPDH
jgi:hypothetical protein